MKLLASLVFLGITVGIYYLVVYLSGDSILGAVVSLGALILWVVDSNSMYLEDVVWKYTKKLRDDE